MAANGEAANQGGTSVHGLGNGMANEKVAA